MSKKMRFLSFFLALAMVISSAPIVPVYAQEDSLATGMTNPFDKNISFSLNGQLVKSDSYRIPSIVTLADGTVVAAADIRWNTTYDGGGLDTLVARSTDGGKTWSYNVANYLGDNGNQYNPHSTTFIDPNLLVAADGMTVYMLVDLYAYGVALNGNGSHVQPTADTGFDANGNLKLSDNSHYSYNYYLKNGKIYDYSNNVVEGYEVDAYFNITYTQNGENKKSNLFFADSPFKVARTQYLYLTKSTDGGATWSEPNLLDVRAKAKMAATENALLVSPGNSITTSGGIMVYPVYSYKTDGTQHVALIYSTDGVNWMRSSDYTALNWSSEGAIVELENGNIRVFVRNKTKHLCYVDFDVRKMTWIGHTDTGVPTNSNTQLSAITYSKTSNGDQVVLVSCPTGPNGAGSDNNDGSMRTNGKIHVFTVNAAGEMTLKNTINVFDKMATSQLSGSNYTEEKGFFAYSALTELSDGSIALLYENNQFSWGAGKGKYFTITNKGFASSALGIKLDKPETVIVDANGAAVSSVKLGMYETTKLQANFLYNSSADIRYQWQIEYESGKWVDIYGENQKSIELSFGMVGTLLGSDGKVNIRCKTSDAVNVVYSNSIPVTIAMYQPENPDIEVSESITTSTGETVQVNVAGFIPKDASVQLSETDSSGIEVGSGEAVVMALDISIKNADGSEWQPASGETVTVTLEASKIGLQNGDQVVVYHLHEGTVKVLGSFAVANNTISFDVDGFSKFVFAVTEDDNYDEMIGLYAGFNAWNEWTGEGSFDYFWLKADPTSKTEEMYSWSIYDKDFEIDQVVKINGYFIDSERNLWFRVEAVNGLELPETLKERPWIYLNNLDEYDGEYDTLFFFEPEDPSEEDIAVLDKYGLSVWELYIYSDEKREITVQTNLTGEVKYQWEVCYDTENLLWTAIEGQTSPTLNLSFGMLSGVLQDGEWAALRCVAYNATESVASNAIVARVILTENLTRSGQQHVIVVTAAPEAFAFGRAAAPLMLAKSAAPIANDDKVIVTLTAKKEDGTIILQEPYELEYNGAVSQEVEIPYIKGYDLCDANGNILTPDPTKNAYVYTVNETDVTQSFEIVLTYKPGKTTYKVTYYLQNALDEQYTQYGDPVILEGITGEMVDVSNEAFSETFDGFYQLLFETAEIASDGSTNIEIYYDRLYYKMLFDLDGGYGVQPVYARYGTPISVDNPTKAGYIFVGWDSNKGWTEDFVSGEVTEWDLDEDTAAEIEQFMNVPIPAYHTSYTAIWRANDASKVTVVVWGQNADDDGYSYVSEETFEIYANTGSTITYVPGQYMCGFEAHTHNSGCSTTCGEIEHTHSVANGCYDRICGKDEHTAHTDACWNCGGIKNHTISCYRTSDGTLSTSPETDPGRLTSLRNEDGPNYGNLYRIYSSGYRYYFKLGDYFYRITGNGIDRQTTVTLRNNCGHTNLHTEHDSSCAMTCEEHTHSDACYKLNCQTAEHSHSASCYNCGKKAHTHDASCRHTTSYDNNKLWDLNEKETGSVTVAADGTTVYNVYYDRTVYTLTFFAGGSQVYQIVERWGADISDHWPIKGTNGITYGDGQRWDPDYDYNHDSDTFSEVLVFIERMPQESFYLGLSTKSVGGEYAKYEMHYMIEALPGASNTVNYNGKTFVEYKVVYAVYSYVTKAEDFFDLQGFTQWASNPNMSGSSWENDKNPVIYFYYTRDTSKLVFNNYGTNVRDEDVLYQAPLTQYGSYTLPASDAPDYYEDGSVTFKGWYLSPQVPGNFNFENETPFDFTAATMPEGDLILYAWWQPVSHNVTFYHSYENLKADQVYTVDGITYNYDVPHGSTIQSPYTPPADPTNGKYDFLGWFYINEQGIETLWDFKNTTVTSDVKIYAKWTSNTLMNYTVKFVYKDANGNEIEIADPITGSALAGNTKTFDAKVGSALKAGYQTRYFPEIQSHSLTIDIEDETKNVYTFYYVYRQTVPYSVYYLTKDNPNTGLGTTTYNGQTYYLIAKTKTVAQNEKAIVTENAELIVGYVFDEYQKRLYIDPNDSSNNVVYFFYEKDNVNGQYIVHYMTEKSDGSGFEEHSSFTGKMSSGSFYSVPNPPKEIEHFTWDKGHEGEVMSGTVTAGEILELWVYYTRDEYSYKVQYLDQATGLPVHTEKNGSANWESQVTENWVEIEGYELVSDQSYTIDISADPNQNVITFYYVKDVTINYQVVGPTGCGAVNPTSETIGAMNGQAGGSTATASSSVYKFVGWYLDSDCKNPVPTEWVDTSGKITPQKPGELWVNATYYAKFEYNLTSLTIDKAFPSGADYSMDVNQSFLFDVVEVDANGNVVSNGVNLTVTIHGNGAVTIDGLTVGNRYKITEITDWSWRYDKCNVSLSDGLSGATSETSAIVVLTADPAVNKVFFTNIRSNEQWLDGDSWCNNIFK